MPQTKRIALLLSAFDEYSRRITQGIGRSAHVQANWDFYLHVGQPRTLREIAGWPADGVMQMRPPARFYRVAQQARQGHAQDHLVLRRGLVGSYCNGLPTKDAQAIPTRHVGAVRNHTVPQLYSARKGLPRKQNGSCRRPGSGPVSAPVAARSAERTAPLRVPLFRGPLAAEAAMFGAVLH